MAYTGEDLRLPLEPGEPIRIRREGVGEDLQGDSREPGSHRTEGSHRVCLLIEGFLSGYRVIQ